MTASRFLRMRALVVLISASASVIVRRDMGPPKEGALTAERSSNSNLETERNKTGSRRNQGFPRIAISMRAGQVERIMETRPDASHHLSPPTVRRRRAVPVADWLAGSSPHGRSCGRPQRTGHTDGNR